MENFYQAEQDREEKAIKEAGEAWGQLLKAVDRGLTEGERKAVDAWKNQ